MSGTLQVVNVAPEKVAKFLALLSEGRPVVDCAALSDVPSAVIYRYRRANPQFAEAWRQAKEIGDAVTLSHLEAECDRRGRIGFKKGVWHNGELVGTETVFSDNLLMFRTKRLDPQYRDRVDVELSGPDKGPLVFMWDTGEERPVTIEGETVASAPPSDRAE